MGLFKKNPSVVPNRAANTNRRPAQSTDQWAESLKQKGAATPAGQARTADMNKKLAKDSWKNNNYKMAKVGQEAWSHKYSKPEPPKKTTGKTITSQGEKDVSRGNW